MKSTGVLPESLKDAAMMVESALRPHPRGDEVRRHLPLLAQLAEQSSTIAALRDVIEGAVKWGKAPGDWACLECHATSDMLIEGFRCWYHAGLAILANSQAVVAQHDEEVARQAVEAYKAEMDAADDPQFLAELDEAVRRYRVLK